MIKHIVTFRFKGTAEQRHEVATSFRNDLMALPGIIPQLKAIEVGLNINNNESWDLVLTAQADTLDDVKIYSAHQAHRDAVAKVKDSIDERACVDYSID